MLWDIYQQRKIWDNQATANEAKGKVDQQASTLAQLRGENDRLSLACQAMWEILRDHLDIKDDHLKAKILEVDSRDGVVDGKIGAQTIECKVCGNMTNTNRQTCVMCGAPVENASMF